MNGDKVYPKEGYWRSSWNSTNFYECPIDTACLGGVENENVKGDCDESLGYSGRKCSVCMDDYTRIGKFECSKCPEESNNILIL